MIDNMERLIEQYTTIVKYWKESSNKTEDLTEAIRLFNEVYLQDDSEYLECAIDDHHHMKFKTIKGSFCQFCGDILPF